MADNARGIHVSAGIYSREIDLTYAAKSLGITTLGVVGETTKITSLSSNGHLQLEGVPRRIRWH